MEKWRERKIQKKKIREGATYVVAACGRVDARREGV
jgi:hypothetical protein